MRTAVAMSGGVDSSVAAALLKEAGHDVVGVTMRILDDDGSAAVGGRGCCGSRALRDAARVAAQLGIPYYILDFRAVFEREIVAGFASEYGHGRTPNPCIACNDRVKFTVLLNRLSEFGADRLATGHHARVVHGRGGWELRRGQDPAKDQSYFLYRLTQAQMAAVLMPVGELTKPEVRRRARELGLATAERAESQEICFITGDDYVAFLRSRAPELLDEDARRSAFRPGEVRDTAGKVLGRHDGIVAYTVGQRKGLGIAFGERRYVVRLEPETATVVLGSADEASSRTARVEELHWVSGQAPVGEDVVAKVRYQHPGSPARVRVDRDGATVEFDEPEFAIAPGQAMVFYEGDVVLGGGVIVASGSGGNGPVPGCLPGHEKPILTKEE